MGGQVCITLLSEESERVCLSRNPSESTYSVPPWTWNLKDHLPCLPACNSFEHMTKRNAPQKLTWECGWCPPRMVYLCCPPSPVGWERMVQVWPPDMGGLDSWSTIYMMTPGNWARPETWLEIVLLFLAFNVKYKEFSLRKKLLAITFERRVLRTWGRHPWVAFLMLS